MTDLRQRELERAVAQGDHEARLRLLAERVRRGELSLLRPDTDHAAARWVRELLDAGVIATGAFVRLGTATYPSPGGWPDAWWWIRRMFGGDVELVRLHRLERTPLATSSAKSRARNLLSLGRRGSVRSDVADWFARSLAEVSLERLSAEVADARALERIRAKKGGCPSDPRT